MISKHRNITRGLVAVLAIGTMMLTEAAAQSPERNSRDFELGKAIEILANIMREFESGHVEDVTAAELLDAASRGMTLATDPYSEYLSEEAMADFEMLTTGRYAGVGSLIRKKGDYILFAQPYKGSPSDMAGVKIGDKILTIDGEDMKGRTASDISSRLRGEPETEVVVVVERNYDSAIDTLHITRRRISIPSVGYAGYIRDGIA
ncbi:MAG: PDZ domain-containing protein, partial [Alistipes sp.]|nr:PDZ domain-containing protein [Alistipes sp.]